MIVVLLFNPIPLFFDSCELGVQILLGIESRLLMLKRLISALRLLLGGSNFLYIEEYSGDYGENTLHESGSFNSNKGVYSLMLFILSFGICFT